MPVVRLKGLNRVRKQLKDGREVVYWYAWKGGPKLEGKPGSPKFMASYNRAVADRRAPTAETLAALVARYRASPEWAKNSDSTKRLWSRFLDKISADETDRDIGGISWAALDDRRVRADLLDWRDQWADRPRQADYAIQVLSRVLSFGVDRGHLAINAVAGVSQLYSNDRADQIWTPAEVEAYVAAAKSPEVGYIVRLACLTGLRRGDLARLSWSHVGDIAIVIPAGKSRGKKDAIVPLLPETKALLAEIRSQQTQRREALQAAAAKKRKPEPPAPLTVLSNTRGKPWSENGLEHQVIDTKAAAGVSKHLHDARGTFVTRLRRAGLSAPEIADVLAWTEERVERLLAVYVDMNDVVRSIAKRIQQNEAGTKTPN